jgi:hypothetical protein
MGGFRENLKVSSPPNADCSEILTPEAIDFVAQLARRFQPGLEQLLAKRVKVQAEFDAGKKLDFNPHTQDIRDNDWKVDLPSLYTISSHMPRPSHIPQEAQGPGRGRCREGAGSQSPHVYTQYTRDEDWEVDLPLVNTVSPYLSRSSPAWDDGSAHLPAPAFLHNTNLQCVHMDGFCVRTVHRNAQVAVSNGPSTDIGFPLPLP